jgi:hypothetical protein
MHSLVASTSLSQRLPVETLYKRIPKHHTMHTNHLPFGLELAISPYLPRSRVVS